MENAQQTVRRKGYAFLTQKEVYLANADVRNELQGIISL